MAKTQSSPTETPEEQEAAERAKSKAARTAGDSVADIPAATSSATEGEPREDASSARQTYTKDALIKGAGRMLGVPPWTVAGALHDVADDDLLTIDRATSLVEKFSDRGQRS